MVPLVRLELTTSALRGTVWHELLREDTPNSVLVPVIDDGQVLLMQFDTRRLNHTFEKCFSVQIQPDDAKAKASLWLDIQRGVPFKCTAILKIRNANDDEFVHLYFRQAFAGYDSTILVEKPELNVAPPGMRLADDVEVHFNSTSPQSDISLKNPPPVDQSLV